MSLLDEIKAVYPELTDDDFANGVIKLQNDSDGYGDYIAEWHYDKPIPAGMKVGKN